MEGKKTLLAAEQERPDVVAARAAFRAAVARVPVEDLVSLDESGATTAMVELSSDGVETSRRR